MVVLHPASVTLLGRELAGVESVAVNRRARGGAGHAEEWSDLGPHCVFVDVPEQRVTVSVRRVVTADEPTPARPGDAGTLQFRTGQSLGAARGRQYAAQVVVLAVRHEAGPPAGVRQRIEMQAVSSTGAADPLQEQEASS